MTEFALFANLDPILKALQRATEKRPITIEALREISEQEEIDIAELYTMLDQMHIALKVGRVSGMREGKPVLAYYPLADLIPAEPEAPAAPPRAHRLPPKAAAAARPTTPKETTVTNKRAVGICPAIVEIVEAQPGISMEMLHTAVIKKLGTEVTIKQVTASCYFLRTDKKIMFGGYGKHKAIRPYGAAPTPLKGTPKPTASATLEHATKAAQCADLLVNDMKALTQTSNPLVSELVCDLLPAAHQLSTKLARLAGHIQQLTQGDHP